MFGCQGLIFRTSATNALSPLCFSPMTSTITAAPARGLAIKTKFAGPTNTLGSRVIATYKRSHEETLRATTGWRHECSAERNHLAAAQKLLAKLNADRVAYFEEVGVPASEYSLFEIVATGWDQDSYIFLAG